MPSKTKQPVKKYVLSEQRVKEITQRLKDHVREVMRLQAAGKLPYASRVPKVYLSRRDIMDVLDRGYSTAGKIIANIRANKDKERRHYITIKDLADETKIEEHYIQRFFDMSFGAHQKKKK